MRILESSGPKYTVVFEHPDDGVSIHSFFVDDENEPSAFAEQEVWDEWTEKLKKEVWKKFNASGYWHTMTLTSEYVIEGKAYVATICEEEYCG